MSYVWVRVPELEPGGADLIYAYWGKPGAGQEAYTTNGTMWTNGYAGVWHMGETNAQDSTTNAFHGTSNGNSDTNGIVGGAQDFGSADDLAIGDLAASAHTVSLFAHLPYQVTGTDNYDYRIPVLNVQTLADGSRRIDMDNCSGTMNNETLSIVGPWYSGPGWGERTYITDHLPAGWRHVACAWNGTRYNIYVDGTYRTTLLAGGQQHTALMTANNVVLGAGAFGASVTGTLPLDEVCISTAIRSADWIRARFLCVASNAVFNDYGPVELLNSNMPVIVNADVAGVTADSADMVGELLQGTAPVTVTCFWSTVEGSDTPGSWTTYTGLGVKPIGFVTNSVGGLKPGTRYHYRFYAVNSTDQDWAGGSVKFSTVGAPTVTNYGATEIGQTTAELNGELLGGNPDPHVWIYRGTGEGDTNNRASWNLPPIYVGQPGLNPFDADVTGLLANRVYWYRCMASNVHGVAWSAFATNFTTDPPDVAIDDVTVTEGPAGTTTDAVFTVTLSATSAVAVTVDWETSDGTATVVDSDYQAASNRLSIAAGDLTGPIAVTVNGDDAYEANETFYLNLTGSSNGTLAEVQGMGTIRNDDWTFYVRGDGNGHNLNNGASWSNAWATLDKALESVPFGIPITVKVQATGGGEAGAYDVAARSLGYSGYDHDNRITVTWEGGYTSVDTAPAQAGISVVSDRDGTVNEAGIYFYGHGHTDPKTFSVHRFSFTNVRHGIYIEQTGSSDSSDVRLTLSNVAIRAQNDGVHIDYAKTYPPGGYGGYARLVAENVDIAAGLDGAGGYGVYIRGAWDNSSVRGVGLDAQGYPEVSTITCVSGTGVYYWATSADNWTYDASFERVVVHDCAGAGLYLGGKEGTAYPRVRATLENCTIADNGEDGLRMISRLGTSYGNPVDCIFANNGGQGVNLGEEGYNVFTCTESHNVFYNDGIVVTGAVQAVASNTAAGDPLFWAADEKPVPYYLLRSRVSPAYRSDAQGQNRGAYENTRIPLPTILLLR